MGRSIEYLDSQQKFGPNTDYSPRYDHGSGVAAMVIGNQVGMSVVHLGRCHKRVSEQKGRKVV